MKSTEFTNPHGLADKANHSTAFDLAKLACYAMKDATFSQVVNTVEYRSHSFLPRKNIIKLPNKDFSQFRNVPPEQIPFDFKEGTEYVYFT